MEKSESLNELAGALAKAQSQMQGASKSAENPYFKSKYADLQSCWEALRKPLSDNGLSVVQTMGPTTDIVFLETMLLHTSGQFIISSISLKPAKQDPQSFGSAISYARRYSLAAITGLFQADDDAEQAMPRVLPSEPAHTSPEIVPQHRSPAVSGGKSTTHKGNPESKITEKQVGFILARATSFGWKATEVRELVEIRYGYRDLQDIKKGEIDELIEIFKNNSFLDAKQKEFSNKEYIASMVQSPIPLKDEAPPFDEDFIPF